MNWVSSLRLRIQRADERSRKVMLIASILGLTIPGAALLGMSLSQDVTHLEGSSLSGSLAAGQTTIQLGWPVHAYAELTWTNPVCGVRFYFLTSAQFQAWENGGSLGNPSLTCDQRSAAFQGSASYAITVNDQASSVNYTIQFDLFLVRHPLAWLSLPALFMLFAATIAGVVWILGAVVATEMNRLVSDQESKRK